MSSQSGYTCAPTVYTCFYPVPYILKIFTCKHPTVLQYDPWQLKLAECLPSAMLFPRQVVGGLIMSVGNWSS